MNKFSFLFVFLSILLQACGQHTNENHSDQHDPEQDEKALAPSSRYSLKDFLNSNEQLESDVERIFHQLDDTAIVAQLLMPAIGKYGQTEETIRSLVQKRQIGGLLLLNGTKQQFSNWTKEFDSTNLSLGQLPFLYSADAEPSLVNRKIIGSRTVKKANQLKSIQEVRDCADTISRDLTEIGINYNFAPVVDMSPNKTVGYRSFGAKTENIIPWSEAFIQQSQDQQIIATAKHFPGHGLVSGDTHKSLQVINGELKEIGNYPPLIQKGVLSIMIAHIAVKNNRQYDTKGMPASISHKIVTELLRNEMNFKGLIVTDAMNMGGVVNIPNCNIQAVQAGCDVILMPVNASKTHLEILNKYHQDPNFKTIVDQAAKRIIRMKLCLM